jgi:ADP-ribose pyrophosphatase YjhB (NUDIX family)
VITPPLPERPTARVLLLDPRDRILLMKGRLASDPGAPGAWFTLGGGVEPGETFEAAALREVIEETGFADVRLGNLIWRREAVFRDRAQQPWLFSERYFVARCGGGEVSRAGWQPLERELIDDIRWWTLADLACCVEPVVPENLAELFRTVLAGRKNAARPARRPAGRGP